jgi:hypothetical protein
MKEHDETKHLLSTEANKERLLEDIFNDEKRQGVKELIDAQKQETLEEVAERLYPTDYGEKSKNIINIIKQEAFIRGAKWKQEQLKDVYLDGYVDGSRAQAKSMYSEEDMREAYKYGKIYDMTSFEEWFEQFKKK